MCNELKEAKFGALKWIDMTTEDNHQAIQIDDETGKTYRLDWEESFDKAREEAVEDIEDFQNDYELTDEETEELKNWMYTLHANSYGTILERMRKEEKQAQVDKVLDIAFGTAA